MPSPSHGLVPLLLVALAAASCGARTPIDGEHPLAPSSDARVRPPSYCVGRSTLRDCRTLSDCRWVVAGCGTPALPTGCFPNTACTTDVDCEAGLRCIDFDGCGGTPCTSCVEHLHSRLCLP